ncbi:TetR/AcrR family transcriptional regulator [Bradyrhizobium liaoningense]
MNDPSVKSRPLDRSRTETIGNSSVSIWKLGSFQVRSQVLGCPQICVQAVVKRLTFGGRFDMARGSSGHRPIEGGPAPARSKRDRDLPAPDARMTQLLAAAKDTFTRKGFAATTMDDIAGAAGMSKKTLYKLFESKIELFRAMLLRSLPDTDFADASWEGSPTSRLRNTLREAANVALTPGEIALQRLIIGERQASPALGRMFAEIIIDTATERVVDLLKAVRLHPRFKAVPLRLIAEMLFGMVFGHDYFRLLTDTGFRLNRRVLDRRIDLAIATFCAPDDPADELPRPG